MPNKLLLYQVEDGVRTHLATLDSEPLTLGREPDYGVRIESSAVSGEHAIFIPFKSHWLLKDLDSTNGTWINGVKAERGVQMLVRGGDTLQLADKAFVLEDSQDSPVRSSEERTLIVFSRGEPIKEFPVPQSGRALVIGGTKADLRIDVDVHDLASLVIEKRGEVVVAYGVSTHSIPSMKGELIDRPTPLLDREDVIIDHYRVVLNAPARNPSSSRVGRDGFEETHNSPSGKRKSVSILFGTEMPRESGDWDPEREEEERLMAPPSRRQLVQNEEDLPPSLDILEDKIIIIVGSVLLLALLFLIVLWVFKG